MKIGGIDLENEVLLIAEIGNNHEGSYETAEKLIHKAAEAGARAVKFQTFKTENFINPAEEQRFARLKSFELSYEAFERLARVASNAGVLFLSTPFDFESVRFLKELVPAFKIASGDNNFFPLMEAVAQTAKPIILSGGLADLEGLRRAQDCIETTWRSLAVSQQLAILHCVASYPVPPEQANLASIPFLRDQLGCTVGYSDHTMGIEAAVYAVTLGARIIEKHFTLDHDFSDFRDHKLSATPSELSLLAQRIGQVTRLLKEVSV